MTRNKDSRRAFTLLELLVVVFIIAILAVLAVTQFLKTSEVARADQAINTLQQMTSAQHMYTLDAGSAAGQTATGKITNACNDSAVNCGNAANPQCNLVRCNFLSKRDWDSFSYNLYALNPSNSSGDAGVCGFAIPVGAGAPAACATRKVCGGGVTTNCVKPGSPFATWGYLIDSSGALFAIGGAVAEEGATSAPH